MSHCLFLYTKNAAYNFLQTAYFGAGDGNRTHVASLEGWNSTIELHPQGTAQESPCRRSFISATGFIIPGFAGFVKGFLKFLKNLPKIPWARENGPAETLRRAGNFLLLHGALALQELVDAVHRVQQVADGLVVVQGVHDVGDILGHIHGDVPLPMEQLRRAVDQVGGEDPVDFAPLVGGVELCQTLAEQAEGCEDEDAAGAHLFQLSGDVQHRLAGGDHVVGDDQVLPGHVVAQEFVGHNGVPAVDDNGVIPALIEHAQVHAQHGGVVHAPAHAALVGGDEHQVVPVEFDVRNVVDHGFQELVGGVDVLKSAQGDGVLDPGVVGVKGDEVLHAHAGQLLEAQGAVQGLPGGAAVLAAFIEHGHNDVDPASLAADGGDDPLQVLVVVVGAHGDVHAVHLVGHAIVEHIGKDVQIMASNRLLQAALGLAGAEPGALRLQLIGLPAIADEVRVVHHFSVPLRTPIHQILVHFSGDLLAALHSDEAQ